MTSRVVTVYTSSACPACTMTKRHLIRRGIPFTEVVLESDDGILAAAVELGLRQAPIVCVSTDPLPRVGGDWAASEVFWDGYRPDRIDALAGVA